MSLHRYGLLKCYPIAVDDNGDDNHILIHAVAKDIEYSLAFNVQSNQEPVDMRYVIVNPLVDRQQKFWLSCSEGFTAKKDCPKVGLDFIRNPMFLEKDLRRAVHCSNPRNELGLQVNKLVEECIAEPEAMIYAFGQTWGPEKETDRTFGFYPAQGLHDLHMNQGSVENRRHGWHSENGAWQDGGLIFHFPEKGKWIGVFCAFLNQSFTRQDAAYENSSRSNR